MSQYAVVGLSPFSDVSIVSGPFRSADAALAASADLTAKGWNTEVVELRTAEIPDVSNDEGADE